MSAVVLRATCEEAPGAALRVAGLTVLDRALRQLLRMGHEVTVATDGTCPLPSLPPGATLAQTDAPTAAARLGGAPIVAADVVRASNRELGGGERVTDEPSRRAAEDAIFAELLRGDLGLVARHLNKPVSFRITRHLLCKVPVTPNQVTLGAATIGGAGCALIATGRAGLIVAGLVLAHLQSVLDGCDGELARVRFQQSAIGEWLDTVVDDAMNLGLLICLGVGVSRLTGSALALGLGLGAGAMMLTYNVVAYRELRRQGEGGEVLKVRWWFARGRDLKDLLAGSRAGRARLLMNLGRRDFFVLAWLVLAALGLHWLVLIYGFVVALSSFVVAMGQLVTRRG